MEHASTGPALPIARAERDAFLRFVSGWVYPWAVLGGMSAAWVVAAVANANRISSSHVIGAGGLAAVVVAVLYPFMARLRSSMRRVPLATTVETRIWTGFRSTLVRWARYTMWMVGWFLLVVLIGLALGVPEV